MFYENVDGATFDRDDDTAERSKLVDEDPMVVIADLVGAAG